MKCITLEDIIKSCIKSLKSNGFAEPTLEDILEKKFKKRNSKLITYDSMKDYNGGRCITDNLHYPTTEEVMDKLVEMNKPEYLFIYLANYLDDRDKYLRQFYENMLLKCLEGLRKKYGKSETELLKKKFKI